jgi:class 3 adenylate cyclase
VSSTETEVAVLFADVVGSTRLYELLGDNRASELIQLCIEVMRGATERSRGSVIKTIGDEILAIFPTTDDALNAASEMQQDIGARPELHGHHVAIRIGCHFGPVVLENKDIFGSSVHTANRMTSQAKAGQVIVSAESVRRCSPEWQAASRRVDVTALRGLTDEMELYEILWQQEDATSMLPSIEMGGGPQTGAKRVRVRHQGQEVVLEDSRQEITMGRAEENSVVQRGPLISRLHARIELVRGRFLLIDQSTNGTFVLHADGKEAFVRRDSITLLGTGYIGLGKLPDPNASDVIRYALEE